MSLCKVSSGVPSRSFQNYRLQTRHSLQTLLFDFFSWFYCSIDYFKQGLLYVLVANNISHGTLQCSYWIVCPAMKILEHKLTNSSSEYFLPLCGNWKSVKVQHRTKCFVLLHPLTSCAFSLVVRRLEAGGRSLVVNEPLEVLSTTCETESFPTEAWN